MRPSGQPRIWRVRRFPFSGEDAGTTPTDHHVRGCDRTRYFRCRNLPVWSSAVGSAFLGDQARQRSLASAALLFLVLIAEIEGLVFVAVGLLAQRTDLFVSAQNALFPASVLVAAAVTLAHTWRRRTELALQDPVEMLDEAMLTVRIGILRPAPASAAVGGRGAAISPYGLSHGRTSQQGSR